MVFEDVDNLGLGYGEARTAVQLGSIKGSLHLKDGVGVPAVLLEQAQDERLFLALRVDVVLAAFDRLEDDVRGIADVERVASEGEGRRG